MGIITRRRAPWGVGLSKNVSSSYKWQFYLYLGTTESSIINWPKEWMNECVGFFLDVFKKILIGFPTMFPEMFPTCSQQCSKVLNNVPKDSKGEFGWFVF
jgi:hypothetical protein